MFFCFKPPFTSPLPSNIPLNPNPWVAKEKGTKMNSNKFGFHFHPLLTKGVSLKTKGRLVRTPL